MKGHAILRGDSHMYGAASVREPVLPTVRVVA